MAAADVKWSVESELDGMFSLKDEQTTALKGPVCTICSLRMRRLYLHGERVAFHGGRHVAPPCFYSSLERPNSSREKKPSPLHIVVDSEIDLFANVYWLARVGQSYPTFDMFYNNVRPPGTSRQQN